jgi:hypothetical protein
MPYKIKQAIKKIDKRSLAVISAVLILAVIVGTVFVVNRINQEEVAPSDSEASFSDPGYEWKKVHNMPGLRAYIKDVNGKLVVVSGDNMRTNHVSYMVNGQWSAARKMATAGGRLDCGVANTIVNGTIKDRKLNNLFSLSCNTIGAKQNGEETGSWNGGIATYDLNGRRVSFMGAVGDQRFEQAGLFGINGNLALVQITNKHIAYKEADKLFSQTGYGWAVEAPDGKFIGRTGIVAGDKLLYTENVFGDNSDIRIANVPNAPSPSLRLLPTYSVEGAPKMVVEQFYQSPEKPHIVYATGWREYQAKADQPFGFLFTINLNTGAVFGNIMSYENYGSDAVNDFPFYPNRINSLTQLGDKLFISNSRFDETEKKGIAVCSLDPASGRINSCGPFEAVADADLGPGKEITGLETYRGYVYAVGYDPNYGGVGVYARVPKQADPDPTPTQPPSQPTSTPTYDGPYNLQNPPNDGFHNKYTQRIVVDNKIYSRVCDAVNRMYNESYGNIACSEDFVILDYENENFGNLTDLVGPELTDGTIKVTGMSESISFPDDVGGGRSQVLTQKLVLNSATSSRVVTRSCGYDAIKDRAGDYGCGSENNFSIDREIEPNKNGLPQGRIVGIGETSFFVNDGEKLRQRIDMLNIAEFELGNTDAYVSYQRECDNLDCSNEVFTQLPSSPGEDGKPNELGVSGTSYATLLFQGKNVFQYRFLDVSNQNILFKYCDPSDNTVKECKPFSVGKYDSLKGIVGDDADLNWFTDMAEEGLIM